MKPKRLVAHQFPDSRLGIQSLKVKFKDIPNECRVLQMIPVFRKSSVRRIQNQLPSKLIQPIGHLAERFQNDGVAETTHRWIA
jgi:hypothetical protein